MNVAVISFAHGLHVHEIEEEIEIVSSGGCQGSEQWQV